MGTLLLLSLALMLIGLASYEKLIRIIRKPEIELRDALTGEKLGLTTKTYKRYVRALGSKDDALIMRACREVQERRRRLS